MAIVKPPIIEIAVMPTLDDSDIPLHLSVEEMNAWLDQETKDVKRASEMRLKEATEIASSYAAGKLTPEEATQRLDQYEARWGEALGGAAASDSVTDAQILDQMDRLRERSSTSRTLWAKNVKRSDQQR
jgi:hypothetical protein